MKKILALLLTLSMVFALTACGSGQEDESSQEEPNTTEEGSNLVGVAMPTKDLQRWNQDGENMKAQLEEAGTPWTCSMPPTISPPRFPRLRT